MPRAAKKNCLSDPICRFLAREMLEFHATHEWIAHVAYKDFAQRHQNGYAAKVAAEELRHFRMLEKLYAREWGRFGSVTKTGGRRAAPKIRSELEFFVANWIFDLAGLVQLEGLRTCSWPAYRRTASLILREEVEHKLEGFRRLRDRLASHPRDRRRVLVLVHRWLVYSVRAFGSAGSPLDRLAVRRGLKARTALSQKSRFERAVRNSAKLLPRA